MVEDIVHQKHGYKNIKTEGNRRILSFNDLAYKSYQYIEAWFFNIKVSEVLFMHKIDLNSYSYYKGIISLFNFWENRSAPQSGV